MNKRSLLVRKLQLREHDELKIINHKISSKNVGFFFQPTFFPKHFPMEKSMKNENFDFSREKTPGEDLQ